MRVGVQINPSNFSIEIGWWTNPALKIAHAMHSNTGDSPMPPLVAPPCFKPDRHRRPQRPIPPLLLLLMPPLLALLLRTMTTAAAARADVAAALMPPSRRQRWCGGVWGNGTGEICRLEQLIDTRPHYSASSSGPYR